MSQAVRHFLNFGGVFVDAEDLVSHACTQPFIRQSVLADLGGEITV